MTLETEDYSVLGGAPPRDNREDEKTNGVHGSHEEDDVPEHKRQLQPMLQTAGVEIRPRPKVESEPHRSKKDCFLNMKSYVAMIAIITMLVGTDTMLRYAVLTTLEKRFGFFSYENGILISSYDIGHVVFLLVLSFVGAKVHKPRFCALGGFFSAIAGLLWAMPHFIYGPGPKPLSLPSNITQKNVDSELCLAAFNMTRDVCAQANVSAIPPVNQLESTISFWFLFVSQCFLGAGLAPFLTVAITYIDDNTDPQTSALFVGIFYSIGTFGMVLGFLLGAVTTSLYVDLSPTFLTPTDPEWVGAWWLGSLAIGGLNGLCSISLLFFPRKMRQEQTISPRLSMYSRESIHSQEEKSQTEKMRRMLQKKVSEIHEPSLKAFSTASKGVFTNLVFMMVTLGLCGITFIPAGIFTFLPKYLETQFLASTMVANIVTAVVTALAMATGTFTGGYISSSLNLNPPGNAKMVFYSCAIGIACMTGAMFLGCPQPPIAADFGTNGLLNVTQKCNQDCYCGNKFAPVCGDDNVNYFSACHAGCSALGDIVNDNGNLTGCGCTGGEAKTGFCDLDCHTMIPYTILIFLSIFSICMGQSPSFSLVVRVVEPEMKSLALGVNNVLTSVLASIPGPIMFGRLIDSTCILMEPVCKGEGICIMYNNLGFRYSLHGVTIATVFISVVCFLIAWLKVRTEDWSHLNQPEDQKEPKKNGKMPEEAPMVEMKPLKV